MHNKQHVTNNHIFPIVQKRMWKIGKFKTITVKSDRLSQIVVDRKLGVHFDQKSFSKSNTFMGTSFSFLLFLFL